MGWIEESIRYPIEPKLRLIDRLALKLNFLAPIYCNICGRYSRATAIDANLRETCFCSSCRSKNRHRQLAAVLLNSASHAVEKRFTSLRDLAANSSFSIYNTESQGVIHDALSAMPNYECSEYLGQDIEPGTEQDGIRHEDLVNLSFSDSSFDFVLSTEVLEHVPDPYKAHSEIHRVLFPMGRHIFTVPFHQTDYCDDIRARLSEDGEIEHLSDPIYHTDPVKGDESALVYTIFGAEMLTKLRLQGFYTKLYKLWRPTQGIIGGNAIVFEAQKT